MFVSVGKESARLTFLSGADSENYAGTRFIVDLSGTLLRCNATPYVGNRTTASLRHARTRARRI